MSTKAGRKLTPDAFPQINISVESLPGLSDSIDRVLEILRSLPMLRRYGGDTEALNEAREILEKIRMAL